MTMFTVEIKSLLIIFFVACSLGEQCVSTECMIAAGSEPAVGKVAESATKTVINDVFTDDTLREVLIEGVKALRLMAGEQKELINFMKEESSKPSILSEYADRVSTKTKTLLKETKDVIKSSVPIGSLFRVDGIEYLYLSAMQNHTLQELSLKKTQFVVKAAGYPNVNNASFVGNDSLAEIFGKINDKTRFVFHNGSLDQNIINMLASGVIQTGRVKRTLPKLILVSVYPCTSSFSADLDFCRATAVVPGDSVAVQISRETFDKVYKNPDKHQSAFVLKDKKDLWPRISGSLMNPEVTQILISTNDRTVIDEITKAGGIVRTSDNIEIDLTGVQILVYLAETWFKDSGFRCPTITDNRIFSVYTGRDFVGNGAVDRDGAFVSVAHIFALNGVQPGSKFHVCHLGKDYEYKLLKWDFALELALAEPVSVYPATNIVFKSTKAPGVANLHGAYYDKQEFRQIAMGHTVVLDDFKGRTAYVAYYAAWQGMSGSPAIIPGENGFEHVIAFHSYGVGTSFGGSAIKVYLVPFVGVGLWSEVSQDIGEWYDQGLWSWFRGAYKTFSGYHTVDRDSTSTRYHSTTHERADFYATCFEWSIIIVIGIVAYRLAFSYGFDSVNAEVYTDSRLAILAKAADAGVLGLPASLYYGVWGFIYQVGRYFYDHPILTLVLAGFVVFLEFIGLLETGYQTESSGIVYETVLWCIHFINVWLNFLFYFPHAFLSLPLSRQDIQSFIFIISIICIPIVWIAYSIGYHDGRMYNVKVRQDATVIKDMKKFGTMNYQSGPIMQTALLVCSVCAVVMGTRLFNIRGVPHSVELGRSPTGAIAASGVIGSTILIVGFNLSKTLIRVDFWGTKKSFVDKIQAELPKLIKSENNSKVFILTCDLKYKKVMQSSDPRRLEKLIKVLNAEELPRRKPGKEDMEGGNTSKIRITGSVDVTKLILDIQRLTATKVWSLEDENQLCVMAAKLFPASEEVQEVCRKTSNENNQVKQIVPVDIEGEFVSQIVMTLCYFILFQQTPIVQFDRVFIPLMFSGVIAFATTPLKDWLLTSPFRQESDLTAYYVRFATALNMIVVTAPAKTDVQALSVLNWEQVFITPPFITAYAVMSVFVVACTFIIPIMFPSGSFNTINLWDEVFEQVFILSVAVMLVSSGLPEKMVSIYNQKYNKQKKAIGLIPFSIGNMDDSLEIVDYKFKRGGRAERINRKKFPLLVDSGAGSY